MGDKVGIILYKDYNFFFNSLRYQYSEAYMGEWTWVIIGSGNGLSPVWCQAITWSRGAFLLIGL